MFPPVRGAGKARDKVRDNGDVAVRVRLLGPFSVVSGGRAAGPWPRPSARRLCQLVLVSPGRRVSRDLVCEELFGDLDPRAAARSVSKALSMARAALAALGARRAALLEADLTHIWANPAVEVDAAEHEQALRAALAKSPGHERDDLLATALADDGELLADEPYADWALRPRERLEALRQEARLALARDRARGAGDTRPEAQLAAWAACAEHDPASEEAAAALVRGYFAEGHRELAVRAYERCRAALGELGLGLSPWLEEVYATAAFEAGPPRTQAPAREELRTVSVLAAEVAAAGLADPEELRDVTGRGLAAVIAEVEALGGTVTSVSGGGLQAMFGAPEAHEDDPERAARAAFRALAAVAAIDGGTLRIGVETGPAVLGPIGGGARVEYGAVGEVVGQAAALQARARPGSALVGPVTRAAAGHLFAWGAAEGEGTYLGPPMPRVAGHRLRPGGPLVGRQAELAALGTALREAARGHGSVVLVTGEPGLGKTRLVQECRRRAARGTRWLEGSCASYASSTPYGLYQQLLANWAGVTPDQPAAVTGPALERVLATVRAGDLFPLLARMMGLPTGAALGRMGPGELQKQTFAAWRTLISRLVAAGPAVLVLEDLHWADPTSLRLTLDLARLAAGRARLLILATGRPEAAPALDSLDARRLELGPLGGAAEEELARSLMGDGTSREVLDTVLASADGNPLFLEERLSSLLETRALVREQGAWRLSPSRGRAGAPGAGTHGQVPGGPAQPGGARRRPARVRARHRVPPVPAGRGVRRRRAAGRRPGRAARPGFPARGGRAGRTRLPLPARPDPGGDLQRAAARRAPPAARARRVGARGNSGRPNGRGGGRPRPALRRRRGTGAGAALLRDGGRPRHRVLRERRGHRVLPRRARHRGRGRGRRRPAGQAGQRALAHPAARAGQGGVPGRPARRPRR